MTENNIVTDNTETLHNALQKIGELEATIKEYRIKLETVEEALAGAHRVIRHLRDVDSVLPVPLP